MFKRAAACLSIVLVLGLAACGAPRPRLAAPQTPNQAVASPQPLPAPGTYVIDPGKSELRVLVYRAGPLAGLGHNHVIVNSAMSGSVRLAETLSASAFSISVPVDNFVVDDAHSRREEGGDFPGEIPEDARSGTLHNMLSAMVLNAAQFPVVTVKSTAFTSTQGALSAALTIDVAGHESMIQAPFALKSDSQQLIATGSLELKQTAIGLTPYSLLLGALQVQDAMQLKFKFVARSLSEHST
ncbi:MAG: YceI family protein [Steroidobacteraceae bacterium]